MRERIRFQIWEQNKLVRSGNGPENSQCTSSSSSTSSSGSGNWNRSRRRSSGRRVRE